MLMSNNNNHETQYEYCPGDFYDSQTGDEDTKDILNSLENTVQLQPLSLTEEGVIMLTNVNVSSTVASSSPSSTTSSTSTSTSSSASCNNNINNNQLDSLTINGFPGDSSVSRYTDYIDELAQDLESRYWENKPPENWTSEDVWHWIFSWAGDRGVDVEEVQPLAYSNMTGSQLIQMTRNDFVNLNPKYGAHIFETLQSLSNQFRDFRSNSISSNGSASTAPSPPVSTTSSSTIIGVVSRNGNASSTTMSTSNHTNDNDFNNYFTALPSFDILRASCLDLEGQGSSPGSASDSDRDSTSSLLNSTSSHLIPLHAASNHHQHHNSNQHFMSRAVSAGSPSSVTSSTSSFSPSSPLNHHLMDSSHAHNLSHHPHHVSHSLHHQVMGHHLHGNSQMFNPMNSSSVHLQSSHSSKGLNSTMNPNVITLLNSNNGTISSMTDPVSGGLVPMKKVGRRGRPPKKDAKSRNRQGKGNGKLWEFIRDLLLDPVTNPSFIRWERREDGIFKFVQSDKVAKLWGQRKQNPRMTYEKLSRAMRYYYKSQVLLPVFGRRLVYKFGPNATGLNR